MQKALHFVSKSLPTPGLFKSEFPGDDGREGVGCHIFAASVFNIVVPVPRRSFLFTEGGIIHTKITFKNTPPACRLLITLHVMKVESI